CTVERRNLHRPCFTGSGSTRHEVLDVRDDAAGTHFDQIDELGGHDGAGDPGMNVGAPMHGAAGAVDHAAQLFAAVELERLHHHREPGTYLADPAGRHRDRLAVAGAGDPEVRVDGKTRTQLVQPHADASRIQLLQ